jgi:hypothetical protein
MRFIGFHGISVDDGLHGLEPHSDPFARLG